MRWRTAGERRERRDEDLDEEAAIEEFPGADAELAAEIERLAELNRWNPSVEQERRLLHLRNLLGIRLLESRADDGGFPEPDYAALPSNGSLLPEIEPGALTPELLRAAILRNGCVLVRGLLDRAEAEELAGKIDRSFAERERYDAGKTFNDRLYVPFQHDPRRGIRPPRNFIKAGGGVLAVDSPMLSFEMRELLRDTGLPALVEGYLREAPLVASDKTTLRKAEPSVSGAWHQDGKFMGEVKALNLWLALTECGERAPGLDLVPRRLEQHVATQTDEAMMPNQVSQRVAEEAAGELPILRPVFEPGDALLFDELFLHKTASDPRMRRPRYALESWFFGASAFPENYVPLAL
ncbi:MAG TPA: phytanoyl-CoA dioxygenase family protein [Solirubrobacteraceae bacterium]